MRTVAVMDQIISQAQIMFSHKAQEIALLAQTSNIEDDLYEDAYTIFIAVSSVLYTLNNFKNYLSLFEQSILCDFLVRKGYTFNDNSLFFTEYTYNDPDFDTV